MASEELHVGYPNWGSMQRLHEYLDEIAQRNWLTNDGPLVQQLEQEMAQYLDVPECVLVSNGTAALDLVFRAHDLSGDIIMPSFTFIASAHAATWAGLNPVFVDIDRDTFCVDPVAVSRSVTEKTCAILGVHVYGQPCAVEALAETANQLGVPLIFDAAHAFGCALGEQKIGGFGDCEIFSLHATKVFNTFEGGAITTRSADLAATLRRMRNFGFPGTGQDSVTALGTNAKMNEFCAAAGLVNLAAIEKFIACNKRNWHAYRDGLAGIAGIDLCDLATGGDSNYQYIICRVDSEAYPRSRDELLALLESEGVLARRYFHPPCHTQPPYNNTTANGNLLLVTTEIAGSVIALPNGSQMTGDSVARVCGLIRDAGKA